MKLTTGYKKPIDSDLYVLLAGGGHKPLSSFTVDGHDGALMSKTFTVNSISAAVYMPFIRLILPDNNGQWHLRYKIKVLYLNGTAATTYNGEYIVEWYGYNRTMGAYKIWNSFRSGYPIYYHIFFYNKTDANALTQGNFFGVYFNSISTAVNAYKRVFEIDILDYEGCLVEFLDSMLNYKSNFTLNVNGTSTTVNIYSNVTVGSYNGTSLGLQETGDSTDITTIYSYYDRSQSGVNGIQPYSIVMPDANGNYTSLTTTGGTGVTKTKATNGFLLTRAIYFSNNSTVLAANTTISGYGWLYSHKSLIDLRYTLNIASNNATTAGLVAYKPVYLVGTIGNDSLFYLSDTWWTQTLPTSADGKIYIKVTGAAYPDTSSGTNYTTWSGAVNYRADFSQSGIEIYWYNNGIKVFNWADYRLNNYDSIINDLTLTTLTVNGTSVFSSPINADILGNATTADRLKNATLGSATLPVYFSNGIPVLANSYPTSLKNPNTLKIQLNSGTTEGTNLFTYDGSALKTVNITASSVGALASNHAASGVTTTKISNWDAAYTHSTSAHAPSNALKNVLSDWNLTTTTADDFIKNKPFVSYNWTGYAGKTYIGWIKIILWDLNTSNHFSPLPFILTFYRLYYSPSSEAYTISCNSGWNNISMILLNGKAGTLIITQARTIIDSTNHKAYIEIYVNPSYNTYLNPVYFLVYGSYNFTGIGICVVLTEEDSLFSIKQTINLNSSGKIVGSITGEAGSVAWDNVTGKPTIPTIPSYLPNLYAFTVKLNGGTTEGTNLFTYTGAAAKTLDIPITGSYFISGNYSTSEHNANNATTNGHYYYTSNGPATSLGASTSDGALYVLGYSTSWVAQIAQDYRNGRLFVRGKNNGTWQNWVRIALTGEALPASDVSAWAKAATKPTYTAAEVGALALITGGTVTGNTTFSSSVSIDSLTSGNLVNTGSASLGTVTAGTWNGTAITADYIGNLSTDKLTSGTLGVSRGGTGTTSFTANSVIMSGSTTTAALTTRSITNNTSASAITASANLITANTLAYWNGAYSGTTSRIVNLGTVTTGTWSATPISPDKGGTGLTTYTTGDLIYANNTNSLGKISIGSENLILTVIGGIPTWRMPEFGSLLDLQSLLVINTDLLTVTVIESISSSGNGIFMLALGIDNSTIPPYCFLRIHTNNKLVNLDNIHTPTMDQLYIGIGLNHLVYNLDLSYTTMSLIINENEAYYTSSPHHIVHFAKSSTQTGILTFLILRGKLYYLPESAMPYFRGATNTRGGAFGFVPKPNPGDENKYLKGDGSWEEIPTSLPGGGTTYSVLSSSSHSSTNNYVIKGSGYSGTATKFLKEDGSWSLIPTATASDLGGIKVGSGLSITNGVLSVSSIYPGIGTTATACAAGNHTHTFASLTSKPTTISGYGITDALTVGTTATTAAAGNHAHGNVTNAGTITSDTTIANGDKLVITDSSASSKIARASISFDGSTTYLYLSKKGTWQSLPTMPSLAVPEVNGALGLAGLSIPIGFLNDCNLQNNFQLPDFKNCTVVMPNYIGPPNSVVYGLPVSMDVDGHLFVIMPDSFRLDYESNSDIWNSWQQ